MDVTIAYITRNRSNYLYTSLQSLRAILPTVQVLIVDDCSDASELTEKRLLLDDHTFILEQRKKLAMAQLYNRATMNCDTSRVLLTNDDIIFKKSFADALRSDISLGCDVVWYANSACFMFQKHIIRTVGWVGDERYKTWYYEDTDFANRCRIAGLNMITHAPPSEPLDYKHVKHLNLSGKGLGES